jgi:hypothetical protein
MITLARWHECLFSMARRLGSEINRGTWTYEAARELLEELLFASPLTASIGGEAQAALMDRLMDECGLVAVRVPVAAVQEIRNTLGPMMADRKPRMALLLGAYRAANGRLSAREVEHVVKTETAAFMDRLRAGQIANAGTVKERRHAG